MMAPRFVGQMRADLLAGGFTQQAQRTQTPSQLLNPEDEIHFIAHQAVFAHVCPATDENLPIVDDNPKTWIRFFLRMLQRQECFCHGGSGVLFIEPISEKTVAEEFFNRTAMLLNYQ